MENGSKYHAPKQMFQRLAKALAQVKKGNTYDNLPNKIHQILYSLYRAKQFTKKSYNNIMNSIMLSNRMDNNFMNSGNSKASDPYRL